jgi:hypothetical protein
VVSDTSPLIDLPQACDRLANETPFRIGKACRKIIEVMLQRDNQRNKKAP